MIVNFYSRTGNNRKVAEYISKKLKCDIEEIREANRKSDLPNPLIVFGAIFGFKPKLQDLKQDPSKQDQVVLCLPVWAAHIPGAVRSYLKKYQIKNLAVISLNGGWKTGKVDKLSDKVLQLKTKKGEDQIKDVSSFKKELDEFCKKLQAR